MIRFGSVTRTTNIMALLFAGFAMAVIVGLTGGNQQAAAAGECGSGYVLKRSAGIYSGERTGTLELYWSNSAKRNCAINRCYGNGCGQELYRDVKIKLSSQSSFADGKRPYSGSDEGLYRKFAGPVYSPPSANSCIDAYAGISRTDGSVWIYDGSIHLNRILCG